MKIGIVCNALANSGGMERYTLDIIRGFVCADRLLYPRFYLRTFRTRSYRVTLYGCTGSDF